jgi:hypothetical protein
MFSSVDSQLVEFDLEMVTASIGLCFKHFETLLVERLLI